MRVVGGPPGHQRPHPNGRRIANGDLTILSIWPRVVAVSAPPRFHTMRLTRTLHDDPQSTRANGVPSAARVTRVRQNLWYA
jgi:hypothetical protein